MSIKPCFMISMLLLTLSAFGQVDLDRMRRAEPAERPMMVLTLADLLRKLPAKPCILRAEGLYECADRLVIADLKDTDLRGEGARLRFMDASPGKGGVVFQGARNTQISGISIEWAGAGVNDALPAGTAPVQSLGVVAGCTGGGALILDRKVSGDFPVQVVSVWDPLVGWPWRLDGPPADELFFPDGTTMHFSAGAGDCVAKLASVLGQHVLVRHRVYASSAFHCDQCERVTVRQVKIHSAPGMGFVFNQGRDISLVESTVAPVCEARCSSPEPSITADASHFNSTAGNIRIEDNDFGGQGDDAINIATMLMPGLATPDAQGGVTVLVDARARSSLALLEPGHPVSIYEAGFAEPLTGVVSSLDTAGGKVTLKGVPKTLKRVYLSAPDRLPDNVYIHHNHLHDSRARGVLLSAGRATIEGNVIERITMNGILLEGDSHTWLEGPGPHDVLVRNNRLLHVNHHPTSARYPSAISVGFDFGTDAPAERHSPIKGVTLEGNEFGAGVGNPTEYVHSELNAAAAH